MKVYSDYYIYKYRDETLFCSIKDGKMLHLNPLGGPPSSDTIECPNEQNNKVLYK